MTAEDIIRNLRLEPLEPEGGFFRQTFKDSRRADGRALSTCIYYLLTADSYSAFHRVLGTEIFHFYAGDDAEFFQLGPTERTIMGLGKVQQLIVPPMRWQAVRLVKGGKWALFGTTVSPGFEYEDFFLAKREELKKEFPSEALLIEKLTRS